MAEYYSASNVSLSNATEMAPSSRPVQGEQDHITSLVDAHRTTRRRTSRPQNLANDSGFTDDSLVFGEQGGELLSAGERVKDGRQQLRQIEQLMEQLGLELYITESRLQASQKKNECYEAVLGTVITQLQDLRQFQSEGIGQFEQERAHTSRILETAMQASSAYNGGTYIKRRTASEEGMYNHKLHSQMTEHMGPCDSAPALQEVEAMPHEERERLVEQGLAQQQQMSGAVVGALEIRQFPPIGSKYQPLVTLAPQPLEPCNPEIPGSLLNDHSKAQDAYASKKPWLMHRTNLGMMKEQRDDHPAPVHGWNKREEQEHSRHEAGLCRFQRRMAGSQALLASNMIQSSILGLDPSSPPDLGELDQDRHSTPSRPFSRPGNLTHDSGFTSISHLAEEQGGDQLSVGERVKDIRERLKHADQQMEQLSLDSNATESRLQVSLRKNKHYEKTLDTITSQPHELLQYQNTIIEHFEEEKKRTMHILETVTQARSEYNGAKLKRRTLSDEGTYNFKLHSQQLWAYKSAPALQEVSEGIAQEEVLQLEQALDHQQHMVKTTLIHHDSEQLLFPVIERQRQPLVSPPPSKPVCASELLSSFLEDDNGGKQDASKSPPADLPDSPGNEGTKRRPSSSTTAKSRSPPVSKSGSVYAHSVIPRKPK